MFAYANGLFQLAAGLLVLVGLQSRLIAGLVVVWLIPVTYFGHPFWLGIDPAFNEAQFYKNLAIIAAYLLIASMGPGKYSLDQALRNRRR